MHASRQLREIVEAFCEEQGRMVGSPGHDVAREYLVDRCHALALTPYGDDFELGYVTDAMRGTNIVGVRKGGDSSLPPVLIGAHYDSVIAAPCADDNAAAVAITLSLAEQLAAGDLPRDVVFAFFDAEEPPYFLSSSMGSVRFVEDQLDTRGVHAAVILDLMGHDLPIELVESALPFPGVSELRDLFFVMGAESDPALQHILGAVELPERLKMIAARNEKVGDMSDHHAFRLAGHPFLFFSCGRWQHYHMPSDTPDKLNYEKMARMTAFLESVVRELSRASVSHSMLRDGEVDTVAFEIEHLEASLGPLLPMLCQALGIESLQTRAQLDELSEQLLSLGL